MTIVRSFATFESANAGTECRRVNSMPHLSGVACEIERAAVISKCGAYRYSLTRRWSGAPLLTFVMLNPSTADAKEDDPTIRRCIGFARREGAGELIVANLYALRSSAPEALWSARDPIGPKNSAHARWPRRASGRSVVPHRLRMGRTRSKRSNRRRAADVSRIGRASRLPRQDAARRAVPSALCSRRPAAGAFSVRGRAAPARPA